MAQATIELGGLAEHIRTTVEATITSLTNAITNNCTPAEDVGGIRQLALDNAETLWPMLHPHGAAECPNFRIIVFGVVPAVRAEIIYEDANASNIIFLRGPTDVSAEAAVEGLLETTMAAAERHYTGNVFRDAGER